MWRFTLAKASRVKPTRGITAVVKVSGNNSSFFLCMIASYIVAQDIICSLFLCTLALYMAL